MTSSSPDMEKLAGELKPCPFCGDSPVTRWVVGSIDVFLISCRNYGCAVNPRTSDKTEAETIVGWNTRTPSPALDARTVEDNSVNREIAMDQILTLSRELGAVTERLMQSEKAYRALERKSAKERRKLESEVFIANSPIREDREG